MNIVRPQMSRRNLLTTAALGVPAMGLLGAAPYRRHASLGCCFRT